MRPVSSVWFLILSFTKKYTQIKPSNVNNVAHPKTTDADVNLYSRPLLSEPKSSPTKTAASIRAILSTSITNNSIKGMSQKCVFCVLQT